MEPLWSPVVATNGNRSQIEPPRGPQKQAKTVAVRCDQLPRRAHGKEGVDGSSPSEGSAKAPQSGLLLSRSLARSTSCGRYGAFYGAFRSRSVSANGQKRPHCRHEVASGATPSCGTTALSRRKSSPVALLIFVVRFGAIRASTVRFGRSRTGAFVAAMNRIVEPVSHKAPAKAGCHLWVPKIQIRVGRAVGAAIWRSGPRSGTHARARGYLRSDRA
jgi:hypothetical protein